MTTEVPPEAAAQRLKVELADRAAELGFARLGVARAESLGPEAERLRAWLAAGHHGTLAYMERTAEVRANPCDPRMLAGARSVVVLATPYGGAPQAGDAVGRVARYARGRDYHNVLHRRLRKLASVLRASGHVTRAAVDSMPVFERAWAQRAGVGFVGKNCCLIVPGLGSHVFLSALITTADLPADRPKARRCGECTACLVGCPTDAFVGPHRLDARRCISYWTIEHRGHSPSALRPDMGDWLFGCDHCQDVCPYNRTPRAALGDPAFAQLPLSTVAPEDFLRLDEQAFAEQSVGSPLRRAGRAGLARNAAVVLGNRGGRRHLPLLREAATHDADSAVRESAAWAIERIVQRVGAD